MAEELLKDLAEFDKIEDQHLSQIFAYDEEINRVEAEAYAAKRDGKKDSHRKLW